MKKPKKSLYNAIYGIDKSNYKMSNIIKLYEDFEYVVADTAPHAIYY